MSTADISRQLDAVGSEIVEEWLESKRLEIPEIVVFRSDTRADKRGSVAASYNARQLAAIGIDFSFCHENHCFTERRATIRGFHYQLPPHAQPKLIRVTRGSILDVNVDIRIGSPSFGKSVSMVLSPGEWDQIYVPEGFAHCYCTLEDNSEVIFKLGHPYVPDFARGFAWNDESLDISWPFDASECTVLERDMERPKFKDLKEFFSLEA